MHLLTDPAAWISLLTLAALEIILGIDNIVVLSILTDRLPPKQARQARRIGLGMALAFRLLLLSLISWMTRLTAPVFALFGQDFSWRDLILIAGGLFLMAKATQEVHTEIEGEDDVPAARAAAMSGFSAIIFQIAAMDMIFSLDSIITAVGMARDIEIMIAAICIAMAIMYFAAEAVGAFIKRHPTTKMLALCFLILIGIALVADGLGFHLPRGYLYFAMIFSAIVETFNVLAKSRKAGAVRIGRSADSHADRSPKIERVFKPSAPAEAGKSKPAQGKTRLPSAQGGMKQTRKRKRRK